MSPTATNNPAKETIVTTVTIAAVFQMEPRFEGLISEFNSPTLSISRRFVIAKAPAIAHVFATNSSPRFNARPETSLNIRESLKTNVTTAEVIQTATVDRQEAAKIFDRPFQPIADNVK